MATDVYGRLRISDTFTIFNYYPTPLTANSNLDENKWISSTSGGTQTYNSQNFINMSITGSNKYIIRYSKFPLIYQSGKSRLVYISGVLMASSGTNNEARIGLYNVNMNGTGLPILTNSLPTIQEGIYLKTNGTTIYWCNITQTNTSEILDTNLIAQTNWNIDIFDGKGPSGKTLTITNIGQILLLVIDQEWLGAGRIRCGFLIDGNIYYAHQFINFGNVIQSSSTPKLRICYYLNNLSSSTGTPIMKQLCSTSMIEGCQFSIGKYNSINTGLSNVAVSTTNKSIILAIRIKHSDINCTYPNGIFSLYNLNLVYSGTSASKLLNYEVQIHSTFGSIGTVTGTGGTWISVKDSILEYYIGTGQYITPSSDGYICTSGYCGTAYDKNFSFNNTEILLSNLTCSQYDIMYIVAIGSQNNYTCCASANFVEDI